MNLYDELPTRVEYKGKVYRLSLSFDRVLHFYDLQKEDLSDAAKLELALFLFVPEKHPNEIGLLTAILDLLFEPSRQAENGKSFDFEQDAKYIYAAFMQTYGIDLFLERDRLHWWKFIALLNGLPSNTRFSEIIQIRLRPIPQATKHNGEEVRELIKQKALFRLNLSEEERQEQRQAGLAKMVRALEGMADG